MTKPVQALEASIAAETQVEQVFSEILAKLHGLNSQVLVLHNDIKTSQSTKSGAVCLEVYPCGKGCSGCPHPRWVRYQWRAKGKTGDGYMACSNLDAMNRDPILSLPRSEKNYKLTAGLIRDAKAVMLERAKLLTALRAFKRAAMPVKRHRANHV